MNELERRKLDIDAYGKYFESYYQDDSEELFGNVKCVSSAPLTFNSWFGTKLHEKYLNILLRKHKLEKIKKNIDEII